MKFFYDMLPILVFFIVYKLYNIYAATAFAIIATTGQILFTLLRKKKPEMMQLITLAMVILFGGATLLFHNEMFIKWKPTAVYWILGAAFFASQFMGKKTLVQKLLDNSLDLPEKAWTTLNTTWFIFFFVMGILNLFVAYYFTTDTWVNFKLFGTLGLTLLFVLIQGMIVSRFFTVKAENKVRLK